MQQYPFKQVDVFTDKPFYGNPVAVVFNADDISDADMKRIANWTNLSETAFICKSSSADYRLRIFTPGRELPFAGHPTIGSAHAAREAGIISGGTKEFRQDCIAGIISLRVDDEGGIHARVPRPKIAPAQMKPDELCDALGPSTCVEPLLIDVGPVWLATRLESVDALYSIEIDPAKITALSHAVKASGVTVYAVDEASEIHVRSFAPAEGILEDPVCGSGNAAVAAHVRDSGMIDSIGSTYTARQGAALGRNGKIQVRIDGHDISIGGMAVTAIDGTIYL
jgi:PhzF family phenazine biosynthesis protein